MSLMKDRISKRSEKFNRRTENTTAMKNDKRQTMIYKAANRKLKIEQHEPH